jgi:serine/threonine protein kinase
VSQAIAYSSPVLLKGSSPSEASDVWALGITIYETLTSESAFDSQVWAAVRAKRVTLGLWA